MNKNRVDEKKTIKKKEKATKGNLLFVTAYKIRICLYSCIGSENLTNYVIS
jgi:hypothetical protein